MCKYLMIIGKGDCWPSNVLIQILSSDEMFLSTDEIDRYIGGMLRLRYSMIKSTDSSL